MSAQVHYESAEQWHNIQKNILYTDEKYILQNKCNVMQISHLYKVHAKTNIRRKRIYSYATKMQSIVHSANP